jgi:hypothetical protein
MYDSNADEFSLNIDNGTETLSANTLTFTGLTGKNVCFGYSCSQSTFGMDGNMDEFGYYNRLLTDDEISDRYAGEVYPFSGTPPSPPGSLFTVTAKINRTNAAVSSFTGTLYNSSYSETVSTTNGTIYYNITEGNYSLNVSSGGYALKQLFMTDINNSDSVIAYLNENNSIYVNIYDGVSFNLLDTTTIDITIDGNTTSYYSSVSTSNGTYYLTQLDGDTYTFSFSNDDYPEQSYIVTLADNEHKVLNAYILNSTYVSNAIVKVIDPYGEYIESALITMQQLIGGSYTTIAQETTDVTGSTLFYLRIGTNYQAVIDKTGYTSQTATITPTSNPYTVTIRLSPFTTYNYTIPLNCVSAFEISPTSAYLDADKYNFSLYINSPEGYLSYFGVYYNSSELTNVTTSPTGTTTRLELDFTNQNTSAVLGYYFKCSGYDLYWSNQTYMIRSINYTNASIKQTLVDMDTVTTALQKLGVILLALILGLLIAWELGLPPVSYPFVAMGILLVFSVPPILWIDPFLSIPLLILFALGGVMGLKQGVTFG